MTRHADFEALIAAYANDLFRYAVWLCRDEQQAEDLVQETLLRAWRAFESLRDLASAKAWLITTLRREHYRGRPTVRLVSIEERNEEAESDLAPAALSMSDAIDIDARLRDLPAAYREVLILQLLFGYSTREMSSILELSEAAIANRLLRARRALLAHSSTQAVPLRRTS